MTDLKLYEIDTDYPSSISSGSYYDKDEVDAVLATKDEEISALEAKLETVKDLVDAARKFMTAAKNVPSEKKDKKIKELQESVNYFSDTLYRERESASKCFNFLMDEGLLGGWGLTEKYFVMPKYSKERLAQFEAQEKELEALKATSAQLEDDVAFWKAKAKGEM